MKRIAIAKLLALVIAVGAIAIAVGQGTSYEPGNSRGLFVVEDALDQFNALKHHGEALAWILPESQGAPDPSLSDHYQGLARYPGVGTPIFYVTQKDDDDAVPPGAEGPGGYLLVFRFGTRPTDGERLRSNLQVIGTDTKHTHPSIIDIWQRSIRFDGTLLIDGQELPAYVHPGGMAIVDDILFVAMDSPHSSGSPAGQIVLFDLAADHEQPSAIQALPLNHSIDNIAVTEQADGTFLIWTNGGGGEDTFFYETNGSNLRDNNLALLFVQRLDHHSSDDYDGAGEGWPGGGILDGGGAHQSSTFLREPDGTLYLLGMRHSGIGDTGSDYADLYRVDAKATGGFKVTRLKTRNFHCEFKMSGGFNETDARICNFAAADNAYVSPSGELILYSMPHDDEDSWDIDGVRLGEFRHRDVNREDGPLRFPTANANGPYTVDEGGMVTLSGSGWVAADRPWVELYDNEGWDDRSIVVDYEDHLLLELNNFDHLDGFGDKTTSVRWRMPVGLDAELFGDDNFEGGRIILRGTGQTQVIGHLNSQVVVPGVVEHPGREAGEELDFSDTTSSMRFLGAPANSPVSLAWDLDDDGLFGETGAAAARGDEVGAFVTFSAADLDGPGQVIVKLRVTAEGVSTDDEAVIDVANIAPTAGFTNTSGEIVEREEAVLAFSNQYDPGMADTAAGFSYSYDCTDDGVFELLHSQAAEYPCYFPVAGTFIARGRIEDKDGGFTDYIVSITVLTPAEAIIKLVDTIEGMNLQQGIDNSLDAKLDAALAALTELNNENYAAAMNTLQAFINAVEAQRGNQITNEQADILINLAQRIINSLASA